MLNGSRFFKRVAPDRWSAIAILSCPLPLSALVFHARWSAEFQPSPGQAAASLLLFVVALLGGAVMLTYPQVLMAILVRRVPAREAKAVGALASLVLSLWYAWWAASADLTGSSTDGLALIFYPITIQGLAWLAAFGAVIAVQLYPR